MNTPFFNLLPPFVLIPLVVLAVANPRITLRVAVRLCDVLFILLVTAMTLLIRFGNAGSVDEFDCDDYVFSSNVYDKTGNTYNRPMY